MDRRAAGVRVGILADVSTREADSAGLDGRVLSLSFEDTEAKADRLTLELDNRDMSLFDREDLLGGALLQVSWGYRGAMSPPRRVVVQKVTGFEVLTIEAYALSVLMHRQERTRRFESQRASDVASFLAREHGFAEAFATIEPTVLIRDVINQAAETDAALLRRLARREGFAFYVDDTGFHFHREDLRQAPTHTLGWRTSADVPVTSVRIESDVMRRVGKMSVRGRDPLTRATHEGAANSDTASRTTLGQGVAVIDPETGALLMEVRNASEAIRVDTTGDAQREAGNRFKEAERPTVKLSVETLGEPTLRAKTLVELRGLPALLGGKYYVTEVRHTLDDQGYVCALKLVRDALGRRAGSVLRPQGGEPNRAESRTDGALTPVRHIEPETGAMRTEYRRDGRALGGEDPEAIGSQESG